MDSELSNSTPNPLRTLRIAYGLSLADLARISGLSTAGLSRIERGVREPSINSLAKIANAVGLHDLATLLKPWLRK